MRRALLLPLLAALAGCEADPVRPEEGLAYAAVAAGGAHTCALAEDGSAWCWGANGRGQLGIGRRSGEERRPAAVSGGLRFRAISAGRFHSCAVDVAGVAWCWGANDSGQLGDGTYRERDAPRRVELPGPVQQISAGGAHSCAVVGGGALACWGSNLHGQLGVSGAANVPRPVSVAGAPLAASVAAGAEHACAVGTAGVFCWGSNGSFQLGAGTRLDSSVPVRVGGSTPAIRVAVGTAHGCQLGQDHIVLCWGDNGFGQMGYGVGEAAGTPRATLLPRTPFQLIGAGGDRSCASTGAAVWCWGEAFDARIGSVATLPQVVPGPSEPITDLSVGGRHACAIAARTYVCWGDDSSGQLGQGR